MSARVVRILAAAIVLLVPFAGGCGKKGDPIPPAPRGPLPPDSVSVRQIGSDLIVGFDVPGARGAKPGQEPVLADVVRIEFPPGQPVTPDPDAFRRRGQVVATEVSDPFRFGVRQHVTDPGLADDREGLVGWTVRYAVRVKDRRGRTSPLVATRQLVPVEPPDPPQGLGAEATAEGVRLTWSAPPGAGDRKYNLYRVESGSPVPDEPLNTAPLVSTDYLDARAATGSVYEYTVRVVVSEEPPLQESASAPAVQVVAVDLFAPAAPTGLVAVQEGNAARVFWNPSRERDLAGYRVYRRIDGGDRVRVGSDPINDTQLLDTDVVSGQRIEYDVTAIDGAVPPNESESSDPFVIVIVDEVRREPGAPS